MSPTQPPAADHRPSLASLVIAVMTMVIALQFTLNVATLVDESMHDRAYDWIATLLNSRVVGVVAGKAASTLLEKSPKAQTAKKLAGASRVSQERDHYKEQHARVSGQKADLESKHVALRKQHDQLSQDHAQLGERHKTQTAKVKATSIKISKRVEKMAVRRVAGMAGEAVPVAGVTIIAGLAALDVMDTCETLVELDDLSPGEPGIQKAVTGICRKHVPTTSEISQEVARNWKKALDTAKKQLPSPGSIQAPDAVVQRLVDGFSNVRIGTAGN